MPRKVRVACIQFKVETGNKEANLQSAKRLVEQALRNEANLIVLPEYFSVGFLGFTDFFTNERLRQSSELVPGPTTEEFGKLLKGRNAYIVLGSVVEAHRDKLYNTSALIGPDGFIGKYRKIHLWTIPPRDEEARGISPGDVHEPFETEFGKIGILLGVDIDNPEPWRVLALKGAEIIAWPGVCPWPWLDAWRFLGQGRAFENLCFVVTTNRVGDQFFGKSRIISPFGEVIATAESDENALVREIDLDQVKEAREWKGSPLKRRYPKTYSVLVQ